MCFFYYHHSTHSSLLIYMSRVKWSGSPEISGNGLTLKMKSGILYHFSFMESEFVDLLSSCGKSKELLGSSREQLFKAAFLHLQSDSAMRLFVSRQSKIFQCHIMVLHPFSLILHENLQRFTSLREAGVYSLHAQPLSRWCQWQRSGSSRGKPRATWLTTWRWQQWGWLDSARSTPCGHDTCGTRADFGKNYLNRTMRHVSFQAMGKLSSQWAAL